MTNTPYVNRRTLLALAGTGFTTRAIAASSARTAIAAAYPRVEWRVDPVGIDAVRPRFQWEVAAVDPAERGTAQTACRLVVASDRGLAAAGKGDVWDSGWIATGHPRAQPATALRLASHRDYWWAIDLRDQHGRTTGFAAPERFVTGLLAADAWQAQWIAAGPDRPRGNHSRGNDPRPAAPPEPLPIFRGDLTLAAAPRRAILSISALGHGDVTVNGRPVDIAMLNPGWTDYRRTILYTSHDVTALLRRGDNRIGVMLGNGMYNVERAPGRYTKFVDSFGRPKLIARLDVELVDGRHVTLVSDADWQVREGPIRFSSVYGGEDVDAREDQPGWDMPGHTGRNWRTATPIASPGGILRAQNIPGIERMGTLKLVRTTRMANGCTVHDFGINGSARLVATVSGPRGSRIRLYPAEAVAADGAIDQRSYNAAPTRAVYFDYILAGTGRETFRPRFIQQGFRYLQAEYIPGPDGTLPRLDDLLVEVVHAALPLVGDFTCSEPLFVGTHRLIDQALRSNMASVLTDCPHREKLGWLEQTHLNAPTIFYNRDAAALYEKIIRDIADTQQANGMVPAIAPEYVAFLNADGSDTIWRDSPEWGAAAVLSPWAAYRAYGDAAILRQGYPAMVRFVDYLRGRAVGEIVDYGLGDWYDLGPKPPGVSQLTSRALTGTASRYEALVTLADIAAVIGRPAGEAARWRAEASRVRAAFDRRFWRGGTYDTGSQCALAMPLALGMVPPAREAAVLGQLVATVRRNGNGVTAGDVGFRYVVTALTRFHRDDVLDAMMRVTNCPGYGQQLAGGATALAEAWNADPTKSLNHFMLGHAEGWFYGALAGIRIDHAAASPDGILTVAPRPVASLRAAAATHRSVFGRIASRWQRDGSRIAYDITLPPGPGGTIVLPAGTTDAREAGVPLARVRGVLSVEATDDGIRAVVNPGRYRIDA